MGGRGPTAVIREAPSVPTERSGNPAYSMSRHASPVAEMAGRSDPGLGAIEQAGLAVAAGGARPWRGIVVKASGVLASLLVAMLVVSGAVRSRPVEAPSVPAIHQSAPALSQGQGGPAVGGSCDARVALDPAARDGSDLGGPARTSNAATAARHRAALARARRQESLDDVLRIAEAFAVIGDRQGVAESLRIAELIAGPEPEARADVQAVTRELGGVIC